MSNYGSSRKHARESGVSISLEGQGVPQILKWVRDEGGLGSWTVCFHVYYAVRIGDTSNW